MEYTAAALAKINMKDALAFILPEPSAVTAPLHQHSGFNTLRRFHVFHSVFVLLSLAWSRLIQKKSDATFESESDDT